MGLLEQLKDGKIDEYCEARGDVDTDVCKKSLLPVINADSADDGNDSQPQPSVDEGEVNKVETDSKPNDVQMMEGNGMEPQPSKTPANDEIQLESVMADCVGDQTVLGIRRGGNEYACRLWAERQNRLISEQNEKLEELRNELD